MKESGQTKIFIVRAFSFNKNRGLSPTIVLEAAKRHTLQLSSLGETALRHMQERYAVRTADLQPRVFYRITDNWLELSMRFVVGDHGVREIKDAISREIIDAFDAAGIGIASATYDIVGMPALRMSAQSANRDSG